MCGRRSRRSGGQHCTPIHTYAISKELGVSYNAVRARVKALEAAG
jgi:DNA-binding Lrp family transcriptional regulator